MANPLSSHQARHEKSDFLSLIKIGSSMDESLAKGLKNHFFREVNDDINRALNNLKKIKVGSSLNSWAKFCADVKKDFNDAAIVIYEGGSNRKPYLAVNGLLRDDENEINDWQEKCISSVVAVLDFENKFVKVERSFFNISEHTISRMFLRLKSEDGSQPVTNKEIIEESKLIPLWSNFWINLIYEFTDGFKNTKKLSAITPIIPSKNGLFFVSFMNLEVPHIEVRTFVDDSHLREEQIFIKNTMYQATNDLAVSPLAFSPIIEISRIDYSDLLHHVIYFRIAESAKLICNELFKSVEDDQLRVELKSEFQRLLINTRGRGNQVLSDMYANHGVRSAQLLLKKSRFNKR